MTRGFKTTLAWGGFCDDRLDCIDVDTGFGKGNFADMPAIFRTRKEARERYQDVRRVEIRQTRKAME